MGHEKTNRNERRNKHLNWEERIQIETLQREGLSNAQIGERLARPARTIKRELERGWVTHRTGQYSAEERYRCPGANGLRRTYARKRQTLKGERHPCRTPASAH